MRCGPGVVPRGRGDPRGLGRQPEAALLRRDLAATLREMAVCQAEGGDRAAARAGLEASLRHGEELIRCFPDEPDYGKQREETASLLSRLISAKPGSRQATLARRASKAGFRA